MNFKKMFSIVLMTLVCFFVFGIKVSADVNADSVVCESSLKGTISNKTQLESNLTKDSVKKVTNTLQNKLAVKATTTVSTKKSTHNVSAMPLKVSKQKTYKASDLRLLSAIIYCEAQGECYAGKVAVGIVVMNRKASKEFPNSIRGVIYQKYQFQPTRNGSMNKALRKYDEGKFESGVGKQCVKAAKEALDGTKKVTYSKKTINLKSYHFFSRYLKGCRISIGNHQFK